MNEARTLVVPYDFSQHARAALFTAADLANRLDADLHLLHVLRPLVATTDYSGADPTAFDLGAAREAAERTLGAIVSDNAGTPPKITPHVVNGASIPETICEAAAQLDADLIVMGAGAKSGITSWLLGSVTEKTLRSAPCPVLTVPPTLCEVIEDEPEPANGGRP